MTDASGVIERAIDVDNVASWLVENVAGAVAPFEFDFITGGHSNLTFKVTGSDGTAYVLRRPPLGAVLATAHDMSREHRIISAVGSTSVPVPACLGLCENDEVNGAPFYLMSYVDGAVLHLAEDTEAAMPDFDRRAQLSESVIDVLAALHRADPDAIGLGELGRKEDYLGRQLKRWSTQWEKSKTRELSSMDEAYAGLMSAKPDQHYTGVVHGDYRLGNMLIDPNAGTVEAVLDWELCTLGDVLADVGYLLNSWVQPEEAATVDISTFATSAGGFASREAIVERYVEKTGFEVTDVDYYRAFQNWRLAAIVEGVLARYTQGVMGDDSVDLDNYKLRVELLSVEALNLLG